MLVHSETKKTITDVWNGYHSAPFREEERHLTAFVHQALVPIKTCPGATQLHRTDSPEKLTSLSMPFTRKVNASMTHGVGQTSRRMLFSNMSLAGRLRSGIVQNPGRFVIGSDMVEFAGFVIPPTNTQPSDKHIREIRYFPTPQNLTDIRSW